MNEVFLRVDDRGRHVPFRVVNGIYRLDVGPAFLRPRDAIDYAKRLEAAPSVSPLRTSPSEPTAIAPTPHAGAVKPVGSLGVPRGTSASPRASSE